MRLAATIFTLALVGSVLGGCSEDNQTIGTYLADNIPHWAGGLPKNAPPRPGSPRYAAYLKELKGERSSSTTRIHKINSTKITAKSLAHKRMYSLKKVRPHKYANVR